MRQVGFGAGDLIDSALHFLTIIVLGLQEKCATYGDACGCV